MRHFNLKSTLCQECFNALKHLMKEFRNLLCGEVFRSEEEQFTCSACKKSFPTEEQVRAKADALGISCPNCESNFVYVEPVGPKRWCISCNFPFEEMT